MPYRLTFLALGLAAIVSTDVLAQGVVMQRNLSLDLAKTIAEAGLSKSPRIFSKSG